MSEREETRPDRGEAASAEVFIRIVKEYGLTGAQKALLKTLNEAEGNDRYVPLEALCKAIGLDRGGYVGYRILTDSVLCPFGYNKTPTWIEFK